MNVSISDSEFESDEPCFNGSASVGRRHDQRQHRGRSVISGDVEQTRAAIDAGGVGGGGDRVASDGEPGIVWVRVAATQQAGEALRLWLDGCTFWYSTGDASDLIEQWRAGECEVWIATVNGASVGCVVTAVRQLVGGRALELIAARFEPGWWHDAIQQFVNECAKVACCKYVKAQTHGDVRAWHPKYQAVETVYILEVE